MKQQWPTFKLRDVCEQITDGKHGDCEDEPGSGFYFLSAKDVVDGQLLYDNARQITEEDFLETHRRTRLEPADILLTNSGTIGRMAFVPDEERTRHTTFQKSVAILKPRTSLVEPRFVYYLLLAEIKRLTAFASGTAQKNLLLSDMRDFAVEIPPLTVQRRIAAILAAYDDLIENSRRRISVLEEMARTLYLEALVRGGADVGSWSVVNVPYWSLISQNVPAYEGTKHYYATADVDGLAIQGEGIEYTFADKPSRAQKQPTAFSLWFARMKDTYKIAWYMDVNRAAAESSMLSSGFVGFQASEAVFFAFLFLSVSSREFHVQKDRFCSGATQMSLTNEGLSRLQIPVPPEQWVRWLGEQALPLLRQMLILQDHSRVLSRTRDLLLPRLISGEVRVENLEISVDDPGQEIAKVSK